MPNISVRKIVLVAQREFLVAVRKKTFLWMTILGPVLLSAILVVPVWLGIDTQPNLKILVCNNAIINSDTIKFDVSKIDVSYIYFDTIQAKSTFINSDYDALLCLNGHNSTIIHPVLYSKNSVSSQVIDELNYQINNFKNRIIIENITINADIKSKLSSKIEIKNKFIFGNKHNSNTEFKNALGLSMAVLIYFFIIMYGMQVMRGVLEEKSSRVVEVMATSVKPLEMMSGKIFGIACVSFTQFLIWIFITILVSNFVQTKFQLQRFSNENIEKTLSKINPIDQAKALEMNSLVELTSDISITKLVILFIIYFVIGYLLYASFFAAIGAAVDSETDTQQFILPLTLPLLLSFLFAQYILQNPDAKISICLSLIPFTSPVAMLVRLPFGVSNFEIVLSIIILFVTLCLSVVVSSKIYRTGLLLYGKKISIIELSRWAFK